MPVVNKYHYGNSVPAGAVNIMRGTAFGNPFVIGTAATRDEVLASYERWLYERLHADPVFCRQVVALRGKTLCCCCAPRPCHGNILERVAEELYAAGWRP